MTAQLFHLPTSAPRNPDDTQRLASDPESSVWVAASAGAGKTKILTDRVLRLMLAGSAPSHILCLTFTKAAAAEMAIRINKTLSLWTTTSEDDLIQRLTTLCGSPPTPELCQHARRLFALVLDTPGGMKIQTIHSFCQSLLRRFPLEAQISPQFEALDERSANELIASCVQSLLPHAPEILTQTLNHMDFLELSRTIISDRNKLLSLRGRGAADVAIHLNASVPQAPPPDLQALTYAAQALMSGLASDQERARKIKDWVDNPTKREQKFNTYLSVFLTLENTVRKLLATKRVIEAYPDIVFIMETEARRLQQYQEELKTLKIAEYSQAFLSYAHDLIKAYNDRKAHRCLLDYDDLILTAAELLNRSHVTSWVLFKLDGGIDHILVDEAQDTNAEQWRVVAALAQEFFAGESRRTDITRTLFVVGDEKQSIFSFQGADPHEFRRMHHYFDKLIQADHFKELHLDISFRSSEPVLKLVDQIFSIPHIRQGVSLSETTPIKHHAFRSQMPGLVELWPAMGPPAKSEDDEIFWPLPTAPEHQIRPSQRLAQQIAKTIQGWIQKGEILEAKGRPIQPSDILILLRQRNRFFVELVRALKDWGIPISGIDRMRLSTQLCVQDLMALGSWLLLPEDDLTLATLLKSPLIGMEEEDLFQLAAFRPHSLWEALKNSVHSQITAYLSELLAKVDFTPPFEFFTKLLNMPCPADPHSGRAAILRRLGPEAEDPLDEFLNACLSYEHLHAPSLQNFILWIIEDDCQIKRELDQGMGYVRIMTVHGSKGLQAPIVFLPDTMTLPVHPIRLLWAEDANDPPLFVPKQSLMNAEANLRHQAQYDKIQEEYRRLLYVALTRAEDRLYVCGHHGIRPPHENCWYNLISEGLQLSDDLEVIMTEFGDVVRMRNHVPHPSVMAQLEKQAQTHPLPDWARQPAPLEPALARPLQPSRPLEEEPTILSPFAPDQSYRFARGILIHKLLEFLPQLPIDQHARAASHFLAHPSHRLKPHEAQEILDEILTILTHPDFGFIFGPQSQAEVPLVGQVGDQLISGQIDRLYIGKDQIWIVDYKSNRPPPADPKDVSPAYRNQLLAYHSLLAPLYPNHTITTALLWTHVPRLMII